MYQICENVLFCIFVYFICLKKLKYYLNKSLYLKAQNVMGCNHQVQSKTTTTKYNNLNIIYFKAIFLIYNRIN